MKTKNIFKAMAMAMLMPAMLLTTACSNEDVNLNNNDSNNQKGYELPVTINVTRQGDEAANSPTNRASYNGTSKKLSFSSGDQLFVMGHDTSDGGAGYFAGTLTWVSGGTFTGTISTEHTYTGTADALFTTTSSSGEYLDAVLLPYGDYNYFSIMNSGTYSAVISPDNIKAFATSKATAIEQFSFEQATTYSGGFELHPLNAILNFTITGLPVSTNVTAILQKGFSYLVSGSVTTDGSGNATFAMAVRGGSYNINELTLKVGGNDITFTGSNKTLGAGHIYNISRSVPAPPTGALSGKFTIDGHDNGKQVRFSKGNLRAYFASAGSSCTWQFATNQWDFVGDGSNNTNITGNGIVDAGGFYVDLFGWVGNTTTVLTSDPAKYGISNSEYPSDYGTSNTENLKSDWGNTIGSGWRTLNNGEWNYIFNVRTTGGTVFGTSYARYAHATIRTDVSGGVIGIILFPDGVSIAASEVTTAGTVNGTSAWATRCTSAEWNALAAKGCVFLPAAGWRSGRSVSNTNYGFYWSSMSYNATYSYYVNFGTNYLGTQNYQNPRYKGMSVRLVRDVE